jgi:hypothetical protein
LGGSPIGFGVFTAVTPAWAAATGAGAACTLGFGIAIAYFGVLGLLVRNPTPMHWGLVVVGVSLVISPWLAGFAGDG